MRTVFRACFFLENGNFLMTVFWAPFFWHRGEARLNVWHYELRSLPSEDRDWLLSNSLVYTVEQPLWEDEDAAHNGDPSGSVVCTQGDTP